MKKIIFFILLTILACDPGDKSAIESYLNIGKAKIHYKVSGRGIPVLLIHGGYLDLSMWDSQVNDLTKAGFRVIRYSDIGHGKTASESIVN